MIELGSLPITPHTAGDLSPYTAFETLVPVDHLYAEENRRRGNRSRSAQIEASRLFANLNAYGPSLYYPRRTIVVRDTHSVRVGILWMKLQSSVFFGRDQRKVYWYADCGNLKPAPKALRQTLKDFVTCIVPSEREILELV